MKLLKKYKTKRNFNETPEPFGKITSSAGLPHFCIQKHAARRLHYDFRLEYNGVLVSWAVPKGPSLDPKDKRLAIKVEDHPIDYQYFEGTIPKGNYGAGTVEIWDHGDYYTPLSKDPKEVEKAFKKGLAKGHISVILQGEKLKGEFNLLKLKSGEDNSWLLIKKNDAYIESEINSPKKKAKFPSFFSPMLATLVQDPFDDDNWLFEIKWDGFRCLTFIDKKKLKMLSRTEQSWNIKFPEIANDLKKVKESVVLDGEIVVLDEKGKSSFPLIQNYHQGSKGSLCYYVFDILYKDGEELFDTPLITRKEILKKWLEDYSFSYIRFSDHVMQNGQLFFKQAEKHQLEGIIGKKLLSTYLFKRSHDWVKIKTSLRQEVVIGGFSAPKGSRHKFGALLIGVYNDNKDLEYIGRVGGGFKEADLENVYKKMEPLIQGKCPFKIKPPASGLIKWIKPKLICEVEFTEWTKDNSMRHPVFLGLRTDKKPKLVSKEIPKKNKPELTHLEKIYWKDESYTKGDLIAYYESIADYILPYLKDRPIMLHRYPDGIEGQSFYQKDLISHPGWIKTFEIFQEKKLNHYLLIPDISSLLYAINLGSIDLHPFLSRCKNLENPDWCVIDIDPHDIAFNKVIETAQLFHKLLDKIEVPHFCKTSGGKGLHILIPLQGQYSYDQSRQFAEILAQTVYEKTANFTSMERSLDKRPKKIYLDCLQNRISQSIVSPYSVRPRPLALISCPLKWNEVNKNLDPRNYSLRTMKARIEKVGDILAPLLKEKINLKNILEKLRNRITL